MREREIPVDELPVRIRYVQRMDRARVKEAAAALAAIGRRLTPKPERQHPEEAIPCPS